MIDIKPAIVEALLAVQDQFTDVQKVKQFVTSRQVLSDAEKLVFTHSAICIGDISSDKNVLSKAYDQNIYTVELFLLLKSKQSRAVLNENIRVLKEALRGNQLLSSTIVQSSIEQVSELQELTGRISYVKLQYKVQQLEPVNPALEVQLDEFLRHANGLKPGQVLTATGDSTFQFVPIDEAYRGPKGDAANKPVSDVVTLVETDIVNKFIRLQELPATTETLQVFVRGGTPGVLGVDFSINNKELYWSGYEWDGLLSIGDCLEIYYHVNEGI
jgi:hypothetical protein